MKRYEYSVIWADEERITIASIKQQAEQQIKYKQTDTKKTAGSILKMQDIKWRTKLQDTKLQELEIISTLLRQIGIPPPTVAPRQEALYKDRQSNRRVGVF